MKNTIIGLLLCLLFLGNAAAQEDPNQIALQRIRANASSENPSLSLAGLGITELSPEIGNLVHLETLWLNHNELSELPPEIGNLINLRALHISHNQLESLPAEIGALVSLRDLDLSYNNLRRLPPEIGNLVSLDELYLAHNQLISLPPEMGNLSSLYWLDVSHNELSQLPSEMGRLPLKHIDISGNLTPLVEMQGRDIGEILRYVANPWFWEYLIIGLMALSIIVALILAFISWNREKKQGKRRRIRNRA
jgi:hypothetical protein